jgi:hypothetical protein
VRTLSTIAAATLGLKAAVASAEELSTREVIGLPGSPHQLQGDLHVRTDRSSGGGPLRAASTRRFDEGEAGIPPSESADPEDLRTAIACVELLREIGNSAPLRPFVRREVMPGSLKGDDPKEFIRNAATTYWAYDMHGEDGSGRYIGRGLRVGGLRR